jgi:hypothetical protein
MNTVEQHFEGKQPHVRAIYDALLRASRALGPFEEDPKKTSIHLNRNSAFAGVATRKDAIILTIKSAADIKDARVMRRQQASANRWHVEIRLGEPKDVDAQLKQWLKAAYALAG